MPGAMRGGGAAAAHTGWRGSRVARRDGAAERARQAAGGGGMVLAELGGAIKGALSKLNNATVIDEEGACARLAGVDAARRRLQRPLTDHHVADAGLS